MKASTPSRRRGPAGVLIGCAAAAAIALPAAGAALQAEGTAGGPLPGNPDGELQAFYPRVITVRAGDSVRFNIKGFHTITFAARGRAAPPILVPTGANAAAVNDPAGAPYWWGSAGVPQFGFNPVAAAPTRSRAVTGARLVNSGFPDPRSPVVTMRFPMPGTYTYTCIPHPNMRGVVRVLPRTARRPNLAAQARRAAAEQAAHIVAIRRRVASVTRSPAPATVTVGIGTTHAHRFMFSPANLTVRAGTAVTFRWGGRSEIHTVTFGPADQLARLERAFAEAADLIPAEVQYPSDPPAAGPPAVTPTAHGVGLVNSGIVFDPGAGPPGQPSTFTAVFPTPGTYRYVCVVHGELMKGTVTVTP